jgi:hypothetical protein
MVDPSKASASRAKEHSKMKTIRNNKVLATSILGIAIVLAAVFFHPQPAAATLPVGSPLAGVISCGSSASCASPTALAGGTIVTGTATLSTGAVTITGLPYFTSSTSYACNATDTLGTHIGALYVVNVSASSITITSSVTSSNADTVFYACIGS